MPLHASQCGTFTITWPAAAAPLPASEPSHRSVPRAMQSSRTHAHTLRATSQQFQAFARRFLPVWQDGCGALSRWLGTQNLMLLRQNEVPSDADASSASGSPRVRALWQHWRHERRCHIADKDYRARARVLCAVCLHLWQPAREWSALSAAINGRASLGRENIGGGISASCLK